MSDIKENGKELYLQVPPGSPADPNEAASTASDPAADGGRLPVQDPSSGPPAPSTPPLSPANPPNDSTGDIPLGIEALVDQPVSPANPRNNSGDAQEDRDGAGDYDIFLDEIMQFGPANPLTGLTEDPKGNLADPCAHSFETVKSDTNLIQWTCRDCQAGPSWFIWECQTCKLHVCRTCKDKRCGETEKAA